MNVTYSPDEVQAHAATMEVSHSGTNSPVTVDLAGEGASSADPGFTKSTLQGFSASNPTAIDFGPDGRAYVATQGGTVYALNITRTGENSYEVVNEVQIDAIKDIPNHDDKGNYNSDESNRQVTGLTVGGSASEPVVYVSSSDPTINVGQEDNDTDTNSGAISRLTINPGSDGTLEASEVTHDVMVLGLPRSEENHATNGLDLSPDGDTLYAAQGGHTNKGAPGDKFGHTPEYALSGAVLEIDLAQIENNHNAKNLNGYNSNYPNLDFYYAIPTIQNDDSTDGDDLPFGGNDGINQAKLVEGGPVQIYSPGYRNPYDLLLAESGQLYVSDHGPNGGWGGQPVDATGSITADAAEVTNHPNEDGSFSTNDQLIAADEGEYGGHAAPIRANPTGADIYGANGNQIFDITESNSPVPSSMVNPVEADYIPPTSGSPDPGAPAGSANTMETTSGQKVLFGPTGGTEEYTASNFGGAMEGDILQVELSGDIKRVELNASGTAATNVETIFNTDGPLGITAQDDDEKSPGTVWTANHGGNDITVFEPVDYGGSDGGDECTGADDSSLDEDGDGYDNADEIDAGSNPCSAASTPADFDGDGTSNVNDPDDDNDGISDTQDVFAVDADNGLTASSVTLDFAPNSEPGTILDLGFTGVMMNGSDYQDLYDPTELTAGGAANVLTVEGVSQGDAYAATNTQEDAFQVGVDPQGEAFYVNTTVSGLPSDAEPFQSQGIFVGTGDQDNYVKFTATGFSSGGGSGVQLATEEQGSFNDVANPSAPTAGSTTDLSLKVYPSNGTVEAYYAVDGGPTTFVGETTVPTSWFDTADGNGTAVGVIATSNGASSAFDATWTHLNVTPVTTEETLTLEEAVASYDESGNDSKIELTEIQQAINWWQTDAEVPNTGGETINLTEIQSLINLWQTDATIGDGSNTAPTIDAIGDQTVTEGDTAQVSVTASDADGDSLTLSKSSGPDFVTLTDNGDGTGTLDIAPQSGDAGTYTVEVTADDGQATATESFQLTVEESTARSGSASIEVTPDSGIDATTYGSGSYQITNTGDEQIESVTFDLSSAGLPDMVFDPEGTAGDQGDKGFTPDSGASATGLVDGTFSQPHNGVDSDDGYDALTVTFDDFDPGETFTFSVDNDPTSIKNASDAQNSEAGPVSGLELSGATVTVEYTDGATQSTDLFSDGSGGGSQATAEPDVATAPSIGVQDVALESGALDSHHSAATVSDASQTVTVSGPADATVTLLRIEGELNLVDVPDADGSGSPGYHIEEYEANNAVQVETQTVDLGSDGQANVGVTLTNTTTSGDTEGGFNYLVAVVEDADGDTGETSNVVVLKLDEGSI